jgi:hypothetical protein
MAGILSEHRDESLRVLRGERGSRPDARHVEDDHVDFSGRSTSSGSQRRRSELPQIRRR